MLGVLCIAPEAFYWMTPKEIAAAIRGHDLAEKAAISRIRVAVWGDGKAVGGGDDRMTPEEYAAMKRRIEGEQPEA